MKNLPFLLLVLILMLCSCSKDEKIPDCGCEANVDFTIDDSSNQLGYLYKNTNNNGANVPDYNFGIWFSEENCINCVHTFLICNDSFLKEFGEIPPYPGVLVKFSGKARKLCTQPFSPADYTYNFLTLTKNIKQ